MENSMDLSVNEKYMDRIKNAPFHYDEEDLRDWQRWAEKWQKLNWKDPKDS